MPNKIHLRGVDILTTEDIKSYTSEHFGAADRIEWIDDTSANLVFSSDGAAQEALVALCSIPVADPGQLPMLECLPAKAYSGKPDASLQIRIAVASDRKQVGAAQRSRFYLLHPEYDPEERRRQERSGRSRYRSRDRRYRGESRDRGSRRYEDDDGFAFDASFYDDPEPDRRRSPPRNSTRRIPSLDSESSRQRNSTKELFPSRRRDPGLRDRSASPRREYDSRPAQNTLDNNRARAQRVKSQLPASTAPKELFPSKLEPQNVAQLDRLELAGDSGAEQSFTIRGSASRASGDDNITLKGASTARVKELFPDKFGDNTGKELFVDRLGGRGKPRQKAEDLFR